MQRKKWTAKTEVTDELLLFREKRKWQLALRRYIIEKKPSQAYAPYFGLDIYSYRQWIELQFTQDLNWDNFADAWQFDHIVPVAYFDFAVEEDLKLCWNFINMRVERLEQNKSRGNRIDVMAVKPYFLDLYNKTGYSVCGKMLEKLEQIEVSGLGDNPSIVDFISSNKEYINTLASLNEEEFASVNQGKPVKDILLEREILKKFGA